MNRNQASSELVACRFRNSSASALMKPASTEQMAMSYKFGNGPGAICFVDLAEDGLIIRFYGEKELTSIHAPAEELVEFVDFLNKRLGLPVYQVNPDFINTVRRIAHKVGGTYTYRPRDKRNLKKGLKAIEMAKRMREQPSEFVKEYADDAEK